MNPYIQITKRIPGIVQAYKEAGKSIGQILLALAENYSEQKAAAARKKIDWIVTALQIQAARFCGKEITEVHRIGRQNAIQAIDKNYTMADIDREKATKQVAENSLKFFIDAGFSIRLRTGQIIGAIAAAEVALKKADFSMAAKIQEMEPIGEFFFPIEDIIEETIREKQAVQYAKGKIKSALKEAVADAAFIEVNGRLFAMSYYADMVARTELINAYTQATLETMSEFGEDLVKYLQHDSPCEECGALQDQIYSVSGEDPDYEALTDETTPPIHPNCECGLQPVSKTAILLGIA